MYSKYLKSIPNIVLGILPKSAILLWFEYQCDEKNKQLSIQLNQLLFI